MQLCIYAISKFLAIHAKFPNDLRKHSKVNVKADALVTTVTKGSKAADKGKA